MGWAGLRVTVRAGNARIRRALAMRQSEHSSHAWSGNAAFVCAGGDAACPGDAVMLQQTRGLAGGIAFEEHLGGKALCIVPALVVVPELASVVKFQPRTFHAHAVSRVIVTAPSLPQVCEVA